jgi:hypothetical protein
MSYTLINMRPCDAFNDAPNSRRSNPVLLGQTLIGRGVSSIRLADSFDLLSRKWRKAVTFAVGMPTFRNTIQRIIARSTRKYMRFTTRGVFQMLTPGHATFCAYTRAIITSMTCEMARGDWPVRQLPGYAVCFQGFTVVPPNRDDAVTIRQTSAQPQTAPGRSRGSNLSAESYFKGDSGIMSMHVGPPIQVRCAVPRLLVAARGLFMPNYSINAGVALCPIP